MVAMTRETFVAPAVGGALAGWVEGAGLPLLLVHGGPGLSYDVIDGLEDELLPGYRVASFQQRGIAPSTTEGPFTVQQHIADVVAVLDHLGWERAILVGHSWGGHLVIHCAAAVPHRLAGVVAVDPLGAVGDGGNAAFEAELLSRVPAESRTLAAELDARAQRGEGSDDDALEGLRLMWPAYYADPAAAPAMPVLLRLSTPAYAGTFGDALQRLPELEKSLPGIRIPVGVVAGVDSPIPVAAARETVERIPGAWLIEVPGAGHFPWQEAPGCVRRAVDRISRLRGS